MCNPAVSQKVFELRRSTIAGGGKDLPLSHNLNTYEALLILTFHPSKKKLSKFVPCPVSRNQPSHYQRVKQLQRLVSLQVFTRTKPCVARICWRKGNPSPVILGRRSKRSRKALNSSFGSNVVSIRPAERCKMPMFVYHLTSSLCLIFNDHLRPPG